MDISPESSPVLSPVSPLTGYDHPHNSQQPPTLHLNSPIRINAVKQKGPSPAVNLDPEQDTEVDMFDITNVSGGAKGNGNGVWIGTGTQPNSPTNSNHQMSPNHRMSRSPMQHHAMSPNSRRGSHSPSHLNSPNNRGQKQQYSNGGSPQGGPPANRRGSARGGARGAGGGGRGGRGAGRGGRGGGGGGGTAVEGDATWNTTGRQMRSSASSSSVNGVVVAQPRLRG